MTKYNKFWIAVITVGANFVREYYGVDLGIDPTTAATLVGGVGAALVYLVPNA
jgi:hypothetical protein